MLYDKFPLKLLNDLFKPLVEANIELATGHGLFVYNLNSTFFIWLYWSVIDVCCVCVFEGGPCLLSTD